MIGCNKINAIIDRDKAQNYLLYNHEQNTLLKNLQIIEDLSVK